MDDHTTCLCTLTYVCVCQRRRVMLEILAQAEHACAVGFAQRHWLWVASSSWSFDMSFSHNPSTTVMFRHRWQIMGYPVARLVLRIGTHTHHATNTKHHCTAFRSPGHCDSSSTDIAMLSTLPFPDRDQPADCRLLITMTHARTTLKKLITTPTISIMSLFRWS